MNASGKVGCKHPETSLGPLCRWGAPKASRKSVGRTGGETKDGVEKGMMKARLSISHAGIWAGPVVPLSWSLLSNSERMDAAKRKSDAFMASRRQNLPFEETELAQRCDGVEINIKI
jgi:hypothetical protein